MTLSCPVNSGCSEDPLTGRVSCQCQPGFRPSGDECLCESSGPKVQRHAICLKVVTSRIFWFASPDEDPCLQRPCHPQASCVHTGPGQHLCACHLGYTGDGRVCVAVDPCQTNQAGCSPKSARCIYDGPGKVSDGLGSAASRRQYSQQEAVQPAGGSAASMVTQLSACSSTVSVFLVTAACRTAAAAWRMHARPLPATGTPTAAVLDQAGSGGCGPTSPPLVQSSPPAPLGLNSTPSSSGLQVHLSPRLHGQRAGVLRQHRAAAERAQRRGRRSLERSAQQRHLPLQYVCCDQLVRCCQLTSLWPITAISLQWAVASKPL